MLNYVKFNFINFKDHKWKNFSQNWKRKLEGLIQSNLIILY